MSVSDIIRDRTRSEASEARAAEERELPLLGGYVNVGIVRVGDTVRRTAKPQSEFVRELLTHLDDAGFTGAPRHHGYDEQGRETLDYMTGYVLERGRDFPAEQIISAGRLLRAYHDAAASCPLAADAETVLHGDVKPRNTVYSAYAGDAVALIDFDNARPGERLDDVAFFAWTFALTSYRTDKLPIELQARRFRAAADGYGLTGRQRRDLPECLDRYQQRLVSEACQRRDAAVTVEQREHGSNAVAWALQEQAWTRAGRAKLADALR